MPHRNPDTKERRETSRLPFWILLWASVFIIVAPLSLIIALHLPSTQEAVIGRLVGLVERETSLDVKVDGYRWWPFSRLSLLKLNVRSDGKDILTCDEAQLSYRLSLSRPYIVPLQISLQKPLIKLERDESGKWQLPQIKPQKKSDASSPGKGLALLAGGLSTLSARIESGTIEGEQNGKPVLTVRDVTGRLSIYAVQGPEGLKIKVDLGQWQGFLAAPQWGEWKAAGSVELAGEALSVPSLAVDIGPKTRIVLQGTFGLSPPNDIAMTVDLISFSMASFPELVEGLSYVDEVTGRIEIEGNSSGLCGRHELSCGLGSLDGLLEIDPAGLKTGTIHWETYFTDLRPPSSQAHGPIQLSGFADLSITGTDVQSMSARLRGRIDASRILDHSIRKADLEAAFEHGKLDLKVSNVKSSLADFTLSAAADLQGLWIAAHQGDAKLDLEVERASLEKVASGAQQHVGGTVHMEGQHAPGGLLSWESWQARLDANVAMPGLVTLKASGDCKERLVDLRYELETGDAQKFSLFFPSWEGKGRLASRGSIKGYWPELTWEGVIDSPRFEYGPVQVEQASLEGKTKIAGGKDVRRELKAKTQNLIVQGNRIGAVSLELDQHEDACSFQVKGERLWNQLTTRLSGKLESLWATPRVLTLSPSQASWKDHALALDGKIDIGTDHVKVHGLNIQEGRQKTHLEGELAWDGHSDLKVSMDDVSIGSWLRALGLKEAVTGSVDGQLHISGPAERPEGTLSLSVDNTALLIPLESSGADDKPKSTLREQFDRIQVQGGLAADGLRLQGEIRSQGVEAPIQFAAKVPVRIAFKPFNVELRQGDELNASFKVSGLNVERLLPYLSFLDKAGGRMDVEGTVTGSLARPVVRADGLWRDGLFQVKDWPHPIENARVEWWADARNIYITKARMQHLGGQVDLTGKVDYPDFDDMEFEAAGSDMNAPEFLGIKGKGACQAKLTQSPQDALLTAKAQLTSASMNLGEFETDLARNIEIVGGESKGDLLEVGGGEKKKRSYYSRLKMGLDVALPASGTWVKGKGLEAEIVGALRLEKAVNGPLRLHGGLQALRGSYTFQAQKLKISEGELVFSGSPEPDPILKITCQREVKDVMVQANVTGPLSQPRLKLSSVPAMNQVDVLSYLLFGHPAGDLSTKQSAQLQDGAASWLGSETSRVLKKVLGDTPLTPDTLGYKNAGEKGEGGVIEIGKYVTPDLYVTYEKGVRGDNKENQVQVEYRLNRNISIQTQVGGGSDQSGVDVFWRYDFGK